MKVSYEITNYQSELNNIADSVITIPKLDLTGKESKTVILKSRKNSEVFYKYANDLELK